MQHLRDALPEAVGRGRRRGAGATPVAELLDGKGTERARRLAARVREGR